MSSTLISTAQAADILGVSSARIRQLTLDGAITGRVIGPRTMLYDVGEIEVYKRATRGSDSASGVATTATPAASPLPLVVDTVTTIGAGRGDDSGQVHLRIWRSSTRTVVLTGPVAGSIGFSGWRLASFVLPAVAATYLDGDYLGAYWINTYCNDITGIKAYNHVFVTRADEHAPRPSWWDSLRGRAARDLDQMVDTTLIELDEPMATIDALVGQTVRHFPADELATPENIAQLAATNAPVPVVVDAPEIRPLAEAMVTLRRSQQHPCYDDSTSDIALRVLWERLDMILESDETHREPQWLTAMRFGGSALDTDHCAIDPAVDNLDDLDWRPLSGPPDPTTDELRSCWSGLAVWLDAVGENAVDGKHRNKELAKALETAMNTVYNVYRLRSYQSDAPVQPLPPYPATEPTRFDVSSVLDEYWRHGTEGVHDSAELRRLSKAVNLLEAEPRYRTAADGTLMARYRNSYDDLDRMIIMWPWFTHAVDRIPDGTHIVASSTGTGHTAVFLREPEGPLKPMPRPEENRFNGWSFGHGSGPTALGRDIGRLLQASDGITIETFKYGVRARLVDHAITTSNKDSLDISVDQLRTLIAATPADVDETI